MSSFLYIYIYVLKIQALKIHRSADLNTINYFMFLFELCTLDTSTFQYTCKYKKYIL